MARFNIETAEKYGGTGGRGFFSLSNDKDTARVRFMYRNEDDVQGFAVHKVDLDGRQRYVNCLREYNDPMDACPFCSANRVQTARLFIPLYIEDGDGKGEIRIWERGKKFIAKVASLCSRYSNLVGHVFEIERNGKKGDQTTTYEIYEIENDDTKLEDLPEVPEILGGVVLDKTYEEMQRYLDTGSFDEEESRPTRRSSDNDEYKRRTPANRTERRKEVF